MVIRHVYTNMVADDPSATSEVRPSDWNSQHLGTLNLGGNTVGVASITGTDVVFVGGSNITLSGDPSGSVIINGASGGVGAAFSGGISNIGNTSGVSVTVTNQLVLAGGNNVTLSESTNANGATITVSAGGAGGGFQGGVSTGGNTSGNTGTVNSRLIFVGGNNVTLSESTAGSSATITISAGAGGAAFSAGVSTGGNTSGNTGTVSNQLLLVGGNNITLSQSTGGAGAIVTISGPNTVAQSNQTEGFYAVGNTTGQSSSTTLDARTHSVDGAGIVSVGYFGGSLVVSATTPVQSVQPVGTFGMSNIGNSAGTSSMVTNQMVLAGGNNITLSESTAAGGITLTISGPNTAAQTNQTLGIYATGNTTGTSSSSTYDARSLSMEFDGIVSGGWSTAVGSTRLVVSATTPAQTNQTEGFYALGNTTGQSSSTTLDARTHSINGGGIVSVGYSGGSVLVSATTPAQSNQSLGLYGVGNTTGQSTSSTVDARSLSFDGAGAISVGMSGGSVVISAAAGGQSVQTLGVYLTDNTTGTSSSSTYDARSLTIDGAGIVSAGWSTQVGKTALVISATTPAQSNQTEGFYAVGNTTGQSSSTTLDARTQSIDAAGIISAGFSGGSIILSATTPAQTNQTLGLYGVGNTTGQSSSSTVDARSLSFDGAGIASVGMSGGSVVISVPSGGGGGDGVNIIEISGNTTGTSTTYLSATLALAGGNNITLSQSQSTITISAANQTVQPVGTFGMSNLGNTVGTSSMVTNQMVLAGGNNVTLSESTAAGGVTITISGPNTVAQSNQTEGYYAVGNTVGQSSSTTLDARTQSFDGAGIVSVGYSGGSIVVSATTPAQSVQPVGTFGVSNIGNSAGTSSMVTNQMVLAGGNNVTLSESTAAGGITVTISGPNTVAQSNQTLGIYATGNTTGTSSSSTFDARSLSMEFDGIISGGWSTAVGKSVLAISATTPAQSNQSLGLYGVGNTTGQSSSSTVDARSLSFDGAGIASVGMSGGSVVISVPSGGGAGFTAGVSNIGNTSGNTSMVNSTLVFAGGNNITLSEATAAGGAGTITISAANQSNQNLSLFGVGNTTGAASSTTANASNLSFNGAGAISVGMSNGSVVISDPGAISQWSFGPQGVFFIFNGSLSNGTLYLAPFEVPTLINLSVLSLFGSVIDYSPVSATTTTVATSYSGSAQTTYHVALYSIGRGTNSTALFTMSSISMTMSASGTGSESSRSYTAGNTIGYPTGISNSTSFSTGSSTISTTTSLSSSGQTAMFNADSNFNGVKGIFFPCVTTLQPGEYAIGIRMLTTTAGNGGQPTGPLINFFQGGLATNAAVGPNAMNGYIGDTNQSAGAFGKGGGMYSVSFSTALQSKIAFSDLDQPPTVPWGNIKNFGT